MLTGWNQKEQTTTSIFENSVAQATGNEAKSPTLVSPKLKKNLLVNLPVHKARVDDNTSDSQNQNQIKERVSRSRIEAVENNYETYSHGDNNSEERRSLYKGDRDNA